MIRPLFSRINFTKNYTVVGHMKPDLDSVASAVSLSYLKNKTKEKGDDTYIPYAAGDINDETRFAFEYFGVKLPKVCDDFRLKARDLDLSQITLKPNDSYP